MSKHRPKKQVKTPPSKAKPNPKIIIILILTILTAIIAIIAIARNNGNTHDTHETTDHTDHIQSEDTVIATWFSEEYGKIIEAPVELKSAGDTIEFIYDDKTYTLPNEEIIYRKQNTQQENYDTIYWYTMTYPDNSTENGICYRYTADPACKNSPGYILYDDSNEYHVAESNIEIEIMH